MERYEAIRLAEENGISIRGYYDETGLTPEELQRFATAAVHTATQGNCRLEEKCARMQRVLELLVSVKFGHQGWTDTVYSASLLAQEILEQQQ